MLVDSPNSFDCNRLGRRSATLIVDRELGLFPDRHFLFQFVHDPLARVERRATMTGAHSQEQRWLSGADKSDPVMKNNFVQTELFDRRVGNQFHLVFGHCAMRFVIDPLDRARVFKFPNYAPEIRDRSGCEIDIVVFSGIL